MKDTVFAITKNNEYVFLTDNIEEAVKYRNENNCDKCIQRIISKTFKALYIAHKNLKEGR